MEKKNQSQGILSLVREIWNFGKSQGIFYSEVGVEKLGYKRNKENDKDKSGYSSFYDLVNK